MPVNSDAVTRLRRIEGQVRGIQRMVDAGAPCIDVLTQIAAARAALDAVGMMVLDARLRDLFDEDADRVGTTELVAAVERFVRR